jgi:hypothetical protein
LPFLIRLLIGLITFMVRLLIPIIFKSRSLQMTNPRRQKRDSLSFSRRGKKHAIASLAVCLWVCLPALAQSPRHSIQAGIDVAAQSVRDDTLVPLAHTGLRLALAPRYFGDVGGGLLLAQGRFGLGYVVGRYGEEGLTFTWGLHASALLPLSENAAGAVTLGPALGWDNETFLFGDWDDAHPYWIGTLWLGPRAHAWRWLSDGWRMDLDGQIGLFGFFSRPAAYGRVKQETSYNVLRFYGWPTHDLELGWIGDFQVMRAAIDFYRTRSRSRVPTGFGLGSEIGFARASSPDPAFSVEISLRLSYTWGL